MTSTPLISIVLPTYNGAAFLRQAVDSILAQTWVNWELILVDDASTDETSVIADTYTRQDARIRVIHHTKNTHIATALNDGFRVARGQYWTWTSDDNLYRPTALAEMSAYLTAHPDIGLVYADWICQEENTEQEMHLSATPADMLRRCVVGPCFLYRAEAAHQVGLYDGTNPLVQDYDYWLRFYLVAPFGHVDKDLYIYRLHSGCLTVQQKEKLWQETCDVLDKYIPLYVDKFPELLPEFGQRSRQIVYFQHPNLANLNDLIQADGKRQTYRFLKNCYRRHPKPVFLRHMARLGFKYRLKSYLLTWKGKKL